MADGLSFLSPMSKTAAKVRLSGGDILVTDVRALQKKLKEIDPALRTQLVREAKAVAKPIAQKVSAAIPLASPLGSRKPSKAGRMQWGGPNSKGKVYKPNDAAVVFRTKSSGRSDTTSLVSVQVRSPMTAIADMAGRSGAFMNAGFRGTGVTREYHQLSKFGKMFVRKHKLNNQGEAMLRKLGGRASRYVWPAAEQSVPAASKQIANIISKYENIANKGFN